MAINVDFSGTMQKEGRETHNTGWPKQITTKTFGNGSAMCNTISGGMEPWL